MGLMGPIGLMGRISSNLWRVWVLWLVGLCFCGVTFAAQPVADNASGAVAPGGQVGDVAPPAALANPAVKPPLTPDQKRRVVVATSIVIVGILALLLLLFLLMVWWSRRTHRLLREPLPAANRGDELWYLKAKRSPSQTADQPDAEIPPTPPSA